MVATVWVTLRQVSSQVILFAVARYVIFNSKVELGVLFTVNLLSYPFPPVVDVDYDDDSN